MKKGEIQCREKGRLSWARVSIPGLSQSSLSLPGIGVGGAHTMQHHHRNRNHRLTAAWVLWLIVELYFYIGLRFWGLRGEFPLLIQLSLFVKKRTLPWVLTVGCGCAWSSNASLLIIIIIILVVTATMTEQKIDLVANQNNEIYFRFGCSPFA